MVRFAKRRKGKPDEVRNEWEFKAREESMRLGKSV